MVLRKPTSQSNLVPAPLSQAANNPPYPTTPTTEQAPSLFPSSHQDTYSPGANRPPPFKINPLALNPLEPEPEPKNKDEDESDYSDDDWDQSDDDTSPDALPDPLKAGGGKHVPENKGTLPDALRPGPPQGVPFKKSIEAITPEPTGASAASWGGMSTSSGGSVPLQTNNPYLRMQNTGQSNFGNESSEQVWGDAPAQAQKYSELVELPSYNTPDTPVNRMADLKLDVKVPPQAGPRSPDQPPLIAVESASPHSASPRHESNASEAWDPGMDISSLDAFARSYGLPADARVPEAPQRTWQEQQAWEHSERERKQKELATAHEAARRADEERRHEEEFYRAEQAAKLTSANSLLDNEEQAPSLPPRRQEEQPPPMPPRPVNSSADEASRAGVSPSGPESPSAVMNKQKKEHYQIKHIRWYDANIRNVRQSPVLTQNINGPCPLLALANALSLSTPSGQKTEFVETLRTREQISLGLLLDAVFEELMSGRRGGAAQELPDVTVLYQFLLGLHTGLNVNPVYVQDPEATDGLSTLVPAFGPRPGGFENTKDMQLYSTFGVPLFHGWLPEPGSDSYIAFDRVAKNYDSAQVIRFQEEELEAKLQMGGLNDDEQRLFTDIHAIKEFELLWPTQLTDYGLKTIQNSLVPGQIAILFRNDHFSTLYKNPHTNELMTLVTDQGYSTHDEIVWESLVDVNGQGSDLYSGDFRAVGNNNNPHRQQQQHPAQPLVDIGDDQSWTTVPIGRRNNQGGTGSHNADPSPPESGNGRTEQEDHDLALALQLQEEEEDRHRRSLEERRQRENRLSEEVIASQSQARPQNRRASRQGENPPLIPPRRNNVQTHRPNNDPAPPPTYEEAAHNPPYHPPQGHPANPATPVGLQGSAFPQNTPGMLPGPGSGGGRPSGRPHPQVAQAQQGAPGPQGPHAAQGAGPSGRRKYGQVSGPGGPGGPEDKDKCLVM